MSGYRVVGEYPCPVPEVWEVLTAPEWVSAWTDVGRGGRPEGFAPAVGTRFRFVGRPTVGWAGTVWCEVTDVDPPHTLRYTWRGEEHGTPTEVTYRLEPLGTGTRFTWEHRGFTGPGGWAMARLLGRVRRRMLTQGLPPVLAEHRAAREREAGSPDTQRPPGAGDMD